jgi:hypothetical protein
MRTFEKWDELEGKKCLVVIKHVLFDKQKYICDRLQIINDEHRLGVKIKGKDLFVYKSEMLDHTVNDKVYMAKDKWMQISIVNKM